MLANLDNEVIFKKAFTDKLVFRRFVRDVSSLINRMTNWEILSEMNY